MDNKRLEACVPNARTLKALGHASRLLMVEELARGERHVSELAELVGADAATASEHLTVLTETGLVESEERGSETVYFLACPCILNFLACVETVRKEKALRGRLEFAG